MCKIIFGYSELKQFDKLENGNILSYGYRIDYDRYGNEIFRSDPKLLNSIGPVNRSLFSEDDFFKIVT